MVGDGPTGCRVAGGLRMNGTRPAGWTPISVLVGRSAGCAGKTTLVKPTTAAATDQIRRVAVCPCPSLH
jgi:hypothetical protein